MNPYSEQNPSPTIASIWERFALLVFKLGLYAFLGVVFYEALQIFAEYKPGQTWPFLLGMIRTWTFLPIHEAGHLVFMFFGTTLMFLGGSLLQVLLPLLSFLLAVVQRSRIAPFPLFWVGENLMDVSLYVRDAPVRILPLLGGHRSGHDWFNLLTRWNALDSAETTADVLYVGGALIAVGAIITGIVFSFSSFVAQRRAILISRSAVTPPVASLEDLLDESLESKRKRERLT